MKQENQQAKTSKQKSKESNPLREYLKYSGLGFQMCFIIGLSVWGGLALDDKWMNGKPVFVLILSFVGIAAAMYVLFKSLPKS